MKVLSNVLSLVLASAAIGCSVGEPLDDYAAAPPHVKADSAVAVDANDSAIESDSSTAVDSAEIDSGTAIDSSVVVIDSGSVVADSGSAIIDSGSVMDTGTVTIDSGTVTTDSGAGCTTAFSGTLATFTFTGQPGDQTTLGASSMATGLSGGVLGRSSALAPNTGSNSMNAKGWTSSDAYYTFSITPPAGCAIAPSMLTASLQSSGTGPTSVSARTSIDAFATDSGSGLASFSASIGGKGARGAPVEIRILGTGASSASGTMRITALTLTGALE